MSVLTIERLNEIEAEYAARWKGTEPSHLRWLHETLAELIAAARKGIEGEGEAVRLREWLEGVRDFADRTMPHAIGQGHMALVSLASAARQALAGEAEAKYQYRNSPAAQNNAAPEWKTGDEAITRQPYVGIEPKRVRVVLMQPEGRHVPPIAWIVRAKNRMQFGGWAVSASELERIDQSPAAQNNAAKGPELCRSVMTNWRCIKPRDHDGLHAYEEHDAAKEAE